MKNLFVNISRAVMNGLYRLHVSTGVRRNAVVFLSRQTDMPSYDFQQLADEFSRVGWDVHMHLKKVKAANMPSYAMHVLRELKLLATCRLAILDRYDPVISLLDFDCEPASGTLLEPAQQARKTENELHTEFPTEPVVVQLWHAFGAYKKFGYQSIGTREGHLQRTIDTFNIHRNYSWVMCSGQGCRAAFAEAFAYPIERVIPYSRPEFFELVEMRKHRASTHSTQVLFAPTLRKSKASSHPFRDLYENRTAFQQKLDQAGIGIQLDWSFHPLEEHLPAPGNVSEALLKANVVVTDYSSIVYEAYLLGVPVLFYVPDLDEYREGPGLNIDPADTVPELCVFTQDELVAGIQKALSDPIATAAQLTAFAAPAFDETTDRQTLAEAIGLLE